MHVCVYAYKIVLRCHLLRRIHKGKHTAGDADHSPCNLLVLQSHQRFSYRTVQSKPQFSLTFLDQWLQGGPASLMELLKYTLNANKSTKSLGSSWDTALKV